MLQNGMGFEKTRPGESANRDDETIVADSTGHVKHSSGMEVDTHYAAQLRPSKLTGRGLTFMVSAACTIDADVRLPLLPELDSRSLGTIKESCRVS